MIYTTFYDSPIRKIAMAGNEEGLKGLWFEKQKYFMSGVNDKTEEKGDISIFKDAKIWLNKYFDGERDIKISGLFSFGNHLLINAFPSKVYSVSINESIESIIFDLNTLGCDLSYVFAIDNSLPLNPIFLRLNPLYIF